MAQGQAEGVPLYLLLRITVVKTFAFFPVIGPRKKIKSPERQIKGPENSHVFTINNIALILINFLI